MKKSKGNFFADHNGNILLDLNCFQTNLPLGYNHRAFSKPQLKIWYERFFKSTLDLSQLPPQDLPDTLRQLTMPIAPAGMSEVHIGEGTISKANEQAITLAMGKYAQDHNIADSSSLSALGFENGYYGNTKVTMSCSDPHVNTQGMPTFDWPLAPFPKLQYPLAKFEHENRAEEDRCLDRVKEIIRERRDVRQDVGAMIIEPVSYYQNAYATPYFFKRLRQEASENGIPFIVDETKTGLGITGHMWAHDYWYLTQSPDIVTFSGKTGVNGFYSTKDCKVNDFGVTMDPNMDLAKVQQFQILWQNIQYYELLDLVQDTSSFLKIEIIRAAKEKGFISNVRGQGNFIGFDVDERLTDNFQHWLLKSGIHLIKCGPKSYGLRPALILGPTHAANFRESILNYHPNFKQSLV